ncbi:MAG: hypothetical protein ACE5QF_00550 [Thermoplasmata archaeon]
MTHQTERKVLYALTKIAEKVLGLPKTASRILKALVRSTKKLSVNQIVERVHSSERSVRKYLVSLWRKGILEREVVKTARGKLAYIYYIAPTEKVSTVLRKEISKTIKKLDDIVGENA